MRMNKLANCVLTPSQMGTLKEMGVPMLDNSLYWVKQGACHVLSLEKKGGYIPAYALHDLMRLLPGMIVDDRGRQNLLCYEYNARDEIYRIGYAIANPMGYMETYAKDVYPIPEDILCAVYDAVVYVYKYCSNNAFRG